MLTGRDRPVPVPTYMSAEQKAQYLKDLRKNRPERPSGSRPPPAPQFQSANRLDGSTKFTFSAPLDPARRQTSASMPFMPAQPHQRQPSGDSSLVKPATENPVVQPSASTAPQPTGSRNISPTSTELSAIRRTPSMNYRERGTRWMERQEVLSIRQAMRDMELGEEKRIHAAAQDEAAELVWKHRNPHAAAAKAAAPYANPDVKPDYRSHLRRGSYRRSVGAENAVLASQITAILPAEDDQHASVNNTAPSAEHAARPVRKISPPDGVMSVPKRRTPSGQSSSGLAAAVADDIAKAHRRTSSGSKRTMSGEKKMFMDPNDRIWEDPLEELTPPRKQILVGAPSQDLPLQSPHIRKNPFARVRMHADKLERSRSEPIVAAPLRHRVEIQRNPPSQSRNAGYTLNDPLPPSPSQEQAADEPPRPETPTREGKEIRDDDIRAATSKSRKDYSPNLPRPTIVSDKPSRPIVSFQDDWAPKASKATPSSSNQPAPHLEAGKKSSANGPRPLNSSSLRNSMGSPFARFQSSVKETGKPGVPTIGAMAEQAIPVINLPDDEHDVPSGKPNANSPSQSNPLPPTITVDVPMISVSDTEEDSAQSKSPLVGHNASLSSSSRPLPHHSNSSPLPRSSLQNIHSIRQPGSVCAHCALPIAGRVLSAAGERFHPSCFMCSRCSTNLEHVAFYPEPERKHQERLERIAARDAGAEQPFTEGAAPDQAEGAEASDDGDPGLRFYCHLDFHELFSPRCKSCKTPIEGEVVVACGAEWHVGHFFCAQCGDPFDSSTPFVEKDGYAWCVNCHTNRYSSKCRKCRKPVTDMVLKALGHDWHAACFVCTECNSEFNDGRYFLRGEDSDPVCVRCEERRLKA